MDVVPVNSMFYLIAHNVGLVGGMLASGCLCHTFVQKISWFVVLEMKLKFELEYSDVRQEHL